MTGPSAPTVVVAGAFDTKREALDLLCARLRELGCAVHRVDFGVADHASDAETTPERLAAATGTTMEAVRASGRASALDTMGTAVAAEVERLHGAGSLDAFVAIGGSGAGTVFGAVAPRLPFGVPKVLTSTIVAGDTRGYLQGTDAVLVYPVVDVEGTNGVLRDVLGRTAATAAALAHAHRTREPAPDPVGGHVAMTMFGITTRCVSAARERLETGGAEVSVFHANGTGGATLERLVSEGRVDAVLDVTTTELADLVAGGTLSAGPDRLTAAARHGVPQVVVPGALDTVNFGAPATVPERFAGRVLHRHNEHVTLMRSDAAENRRLGELVAERVGLAPSSSTVVLPMGGFSELDAPGMPFWSPEADAAFREAFLSHVDPAVRVVESTDHVDDPAFAALLVAELDAVRDRR
ncbi:Tm-1-like ATP-binding domain-containing protein [Phycicoccus sp. BSK3Z-2]|uniref:Tm-1-like ATP-binding domain-containing protein n=1 Tax=Phycicoccus avicenniae TaxID=2828860 RepID=A0A941I1D7_9MICO|nr:Tm-1-like ATP-binding domain-containing protein [Phycicoccus avicenniae]MBR7744815.1 Tm-1-like ATP-binding domain-containing protein [Phycicoccus avicenniae]